MSAFDISRANTESYYCYFRNSERISQVIQIGAASFETVSRLVSGHHGDVLMGSLVDCTGEPWAKGIKYPNAPEKARHTLNTFCNLMLMQSISAFDHFTTHLLTDLCCFSAKVRESKALKHDHTEFEKSARTGDLPKCCVRKVETFCRKVTLVRRIESFQSALGLTHSDIEDLLPLFHFLRELRNCIAHANSFPSAKLLSIRDSSHLASSVRCWNAPGRKAAPPLYSPIPGAIVELQARHAVLANAVCLRIADRMRAAAINLMGCDGVLEMAAYNALIAPFHSFRDLKASVPYSEVKHFLYSRYRVRNITSQDTIKMLQKAGLWKTILARYATLYPNGELNQ